MYVLKWKWDNRSELPNKKGILYFHKNLHHQSFLLPPFSINNKTGRTSTWLLTYSHILSCSLLILVCLMRWCITLMFKWVIVIAVRRSSTVCFTHSVSRVARSWCTQGLRCCSRDFQKNVSSTTWCRPHSGALQVQLVVTV